jgi:hypothetical protein
LRRQGSLGIFPDRAPQPQRLDQGLSTLAAGRRQYDGLCGKRRNSRHYSRGGGRQKTSTCFASCHGLILCVCMVILRSVPSSVPEGQHSPHRNVGPRNPLLFVRLTVSTVRCEAPSRVSGKTISQYSRRHFDRDQLGPIEGMATNFGHRRLQTSSCHMQQFCQACARLA